MPTEDKNIGEPTLAKPVRVGRPDIGWDSKSAPTPDASDNLPTWRRLTQSLSAKLIALLVSGMVIIFALLGYANIRLHRQDLESATLVSAERVSDVIKRSTSYYMMHNDRDGLYANITAMANEPGIVRIRIYDQEGTVRYSSDATELNHTVDKSAEACYACHAQAQPLARLNRPDRFRIFSHNGSGRVLAIITPIENEPRCSNAACHAHPANQQILGVLDTHMSLARADAAQKASTRQMAIYTVLAVVLIGLICAVFVMRVVGGPIKDLKHGTEELTYGDLGYQIQVESRDELGELAESFNVMSLRLRAARSWRMRSTTPCQGS